MCAVRDLYIQEYAEKMAAAVNARVSVRALPNRESRVSDYRTVFLQDGMLLAGGVHEHYHLVLIQRPSHKLDRPAKTAQSFKRFVLQTSHTRFDALRYRVETDATLYWPFFCTHW